MEFWPFRRKGGAALVCLLACLMFFLPGMSPRAEAEVIDPVWQYQLTPEEPWQDFLYPKLPDLPPDTHMIWLRTTVRPSADANNTMLFMTSMQSVRIWIGDRVIYHYGSFGLQDTGSGMRWHIVKLPPISSPTELRIQIYGDTTEAMLGLNTLMMGTGVEQMQKLFLFDAPIIVALPAALLIILIMVIYYRYHPYHWKRLYVAVIGFMVVFACWLVAASNMKNIFYDDAMLWWHTLSTLAYLLPVSANVVLYEMLKKEPRSYPGVVLSINILLMVVTVGGYLGGMWTLNWGMTFFYPILGITEACMAWWLLQAVRRGNILCRAILPATIGFTILGLIDGITGHFHVFSWRCFVTPLGIFPFLYFVMELLKVQLVRERSLESQAARLQYKVALATERAERDALTGCHNRASVGQLFEDSLRTAERRGGVLSAIMLDIDHFKKVNDTYGHDTGDRVLMDFAAAVRRIIDKEKAVIRWGGEEFIVLCPGLGQYETMVLANLIRRFVARAPLGGRKITCSLGVSTWHGKEKDTMEALFKRADRALYVAKESGRNRVKGESAENPASL